MPAHKEPLLMMCLRGLQGLNSSGEVVDFDKTWDVIESSLREIHTRNASNLLFEELYRNAYRLVLKKKGEALYNKVKGFEEAWLKEQVRSKLRASLSGSLSSGASAALGPTGTERRVAGERFLRGLKQAWEDHILCMNMTTDVLMYMDRVYCVENRKPPIFTAAMGLFRDFILRSSLDKINPDGTKAALILTSTILSQIQMEREGDIIDRNLIRSCVYMLEGLYETDTEDDSEKLYLTSFEPQFLAASRSFYRSEAESLLRDSDAATFLRHTDKRFSEESDRCHSTLSPLTAPKIKSVIEDEVLKKHIHDVVVMEGSGAKYMFDNDRFGELKLLYDLISRVDAKKEELCKALYKRVVELGTDINSASKVAIAGAVVPRAQGEKEDGNAPPKIQGQNLAAIQTTAAIKWVDDVLQLKAKCDVIWTRAFDSDHDLQTWLTKGFTEFINAFHRSPEFISLFIDDNLRKGLKDKTEAEADDVLERAIVLLRYVHDKDLFERYHKKHLSKRLLGGRSVSHDVEKQMISKLKLELGNLFTLKMEGMFKDMTVSEDLTTNFKAHLARLDNANRKIELGVNILTTTFWPMEVVDPSQYESGKRSTCIFPPDIEATKSSFETFYHSKHTGRKLTWQANAGSADIRAIFPAVSGKEASLNKERRHEFNVSTYAMVILLLFNDLGPGQSYSLDEIQAKTMIPRADLIRNLQSLAVAPKTRILIKEPMSRDIKPDDKFMFNDRFTSKFSKIKVGVVAGGNKVEGDKEREDTEKENNDSRGIVIEAAVVRTMKGRKELSHQNLLSEVISQLSSKFVPDINMVKKRIESLIERDYLERVGGTDRAAYRYLA